MNNELFIIYNMNIINNWMNFKKENFVSLWAIQKQVQNGLGSQNVVYQPLF